MAVSGGPDSLALLLLADAAFPGRVAAATVDHGLRPESGDEARMVARLCAERGIPHATLLPAEPIGGSLQAAARHARYTLLDAWRAASRIDWVMTGHHADDQLETLAMRLNRSSGVAGLAGIRAKQGHRLRPLLGWRRTALAEVVARAGWTALDDPSNRDPRFDRARMRAALADSPIDPVAASASAALLAEAEAALVWTAERLADERLAPCDGGWALDPDGLPQDYVRRLVLALLARIEPDAAAPRAEALIRAIAALDRGEQAMLGDVLLRPAASGRWLATKAPPRAIG